MSGADRIPAGAFHVERIFGEKIPKCRACGLHNMVELPAMAAWECRECGRREASESVWWVPKDERVREAMGLG